MRLLLLLGLLGCLGLASAHYDNQQRGMFGQRGNRRPFPRKDRQEDNPEENDTGRSSRGSSSSASESGGSSEELDYRAVFNLLKSKADDLCELFDEKSKKLKSLPPADADENSKASLARKKFVLSFVEDFVEILESSESKTEEDDDQDEDKEDWCILKTEGMMKIINKATHHLQKLKNWDNPRAKLFKVVALQKAFYAGHHIIESKWCARFFSYMKKKTEPVLQLINQTYHKQLELPPASSGGRNRTQLVTIFADSFKKIMDPQEFMKIFHKSGKSGHHHHHGGHHGKGRGNKWMGKGGHQARGGGGKPNTWNGNGGQWMKKPRN